MCFYLSESKYGGWNVLGKHRQQIVWRPTKEAAKEFLTYLLHLGVYALSKTEVSTGENKINEK